SYLRYKSPSFLLQITNGLQILSTCANGFSWRDRSQAPTGRNITAQGNALGLREHTKIIKPCKGDTSFWASFHLAWKQPEIGLHFLFSNWNTKKSQSGFQSGKRLFMVTSHIAKIA
ncbi:MAG: hypothetical protein QME81_06925, partial [bacterium]|nr:hypothetical protein [bacterium]